MSLIPYPDVPPLPGVPGLNRVSGGWVGAALTVVGELLPLNLFGTKWGIIDDNGNSVITPDSFVEFEYKEERKIPTYPIEAGGFQSYNKVALPFDCRMTVTCSGNGSMTKESFLAAIEDLMSSLTLVTVVTPDGNYPSCNLIHVDYRREARQGATMIIAQLWFQEIRTTPNPSDPTAEPDGAANIKNGQLSLTLPLVGSFSFDPGSLFA